MIRLALALIFLSGPVWAAQCGPYEAIRDKLGKKYGEARNAFALAAGGRMMETYINLETQTWTVVLTYPSGLSCILVAGTDYQALDPPAKGDDL